MMVKGQCYFPWFPDPCVLTFEVSEPNLGLWFSTRDCLILQERPVRLYKFLSLKTVYLN